MATHRGPPPPDILIGQTIGNYLVTQKLGEGGMGSVYLAEHPAIGKKVALKVLHSEFSGNQEVAARFFNEAKAVNDIGHPNIVDIVDFGIIQAGTIGSGREQLVYFIMEYLAGQTLSGLIRAEAPLPPERALAIALQVGDALAASHKCGIVHRDLKPDNIILLTRARERDFVKLLDFGIAKLSNDAQSSRTRTGIVMGTPAYMSPEQCEGRGTTDHRTDIYALGIVLYEMLTGRVPFIGEAYGDILIQHLTQQPIPLSQYRMLNPHVEAVVMKALEKRAEMRYPTMDEFMRAMSDPVGYVEAQGGIAAFMQRQLMPSSAPLPPVRRSGITHPPPYLGTPPPGSIQMSAQGVPQTGPGMQAVAAPTTLGASAGQLEPRTSKAGFLVAGLVVIIAAAAGIVIVASRAKTATPAGAGAGSDPVVLAPGSGSDSGSAAGGVSGSAVATGSGSAADSGSAAGSAMVAAGSGSASVDHGGSAAGSGSDAGSANSGSGSAAVVVNHVNVVRTTYTVVIRTKPPGAKILLDGKDSKVVTPNPVTIGAGKKVKITLRLSGFKDGILKTTGAAGLDTDVTLSKVGSSNQSSGSGSKGSNDTTLMVPE